MGTGLSEATMLVVLIGTLLFMVRAARGGGRPATSWSDLRRYDLEGQMWAVAVLAGLSLGEITNTIGGGVESFSLVALGLGIWCGLFSRPSRFSGLVPGAVGGFGSTLGSIMFVMDAPSAATMAARTGIALALALLFGLVVLTRVQPLGGLTWFAALDITVFITGPAGVSWAETGGWQVGVLSMLGIAIVIVLAVGPEFVIALAALAVVLVHLLSSGYGYMPGNLMYSLTPVVVTLVGFWVTSALRRRFGP